MTWVEVPKTARYDTIDIKKHPVGRVFQGFYTGKREINTRTGKQIIYNFENTNGTFSIYGFPDLNRAMGNVKEGTEVRITYLGKENTQTRFGTRNMHRAKVEINTDTIPRDEEGEPF